MGKPKSSRTTLKAEMNTVETIEFLADGNMGALSLLYGFDYGSTMPFLFWFGLDDINIRGEQIWVAFKYWKAEPEDTAAIKQARLLEVAVRREPALLADLVAFINEQCPRPNGEQAMTQRASYERKGR